MERAKKKLQGARGVREKNRAQSYAQGRAQNYVDKHLYALYVAFYAGDLG